jgi:hypothetical protein
MWSRISMIGDLLKELVKALYRFCRYHLAHLAGHHRAGPVPHTMESPQGSFAVADAGMIANLPDDEILSETYRREVRMNTSRRDLDNEEFGRNPVFQIWKQQKPRAHKWTHYFEAYDTIFGPRRTQALRILEIGVYEGASLRLWRRYFDNPQTVIVGIDINPACARFNSIHENIHVRVGNQADAIFLDTVTRDFGPFDIIIDDGSHVSSHMIQSFNHLFFGALKNNGIYLAEDLHANYWTSYRDTRRSFLDLCKELMELMHAHYTRTTLTEWSLESEAGPETHQLSLEVPMVATMIKEIRVFDSIVAIYKTRREFLPRVLNPLAD